jgi:PD-(D/E)XK nuclease superfamily
MTENEIATIVVDACYHIHVRLGPGLLESVYARVLEYELTKRGLCVRREVPIAFGYDGIQFDEGFRADLLVDEKVLLELGRGRGAGSTAAGRRLPGSSRGPTRRRREESGRTPTRRLLRP